MTKRARARVLAAALGLVGLLGLAGLAGWYSFFREVPVVYTDDAEHFKYGSIGVEQDNGFPFLVWKALPRVCPDLIPGEGGYAAFGMIFEDGHDSPIGLSKKIIGFPRLGMNCAFCHTSTFRRSAEERPEIVLGAVANRLDVQAYLRFLWGCASDPRFTADALLAEMTRDADLSTLESLVYRYVIIPRTKKALLEQKAELAWMDAPAEGRPRARWGPGRIEPFNPVKFGILDLPFDGTIGVSDMLPLWRLTQEEGFAYHWDGLNTSLAEVVDSSALGDGATPRSIELEGLRRIQTWMGRAAPPPYPYAIDAPLALEGRRVYEAAGCASCHDPGGARFRTVIPVDEPGMGTDRHRTDSWSQAAADAYDAHPRGGGLRFSHFQKKTGYLAVPLLGLWLRAPYLHNGSVPTLSHLLSPSERPRAFYRGLDTYDPVLVGYTWQRPGGAAPGAWELDTSEPGDDNQGHTYGADLPPDAKRALLEYLKTL